MRADPVSPRRHSFGGTLIDIAIAVAGLVVPPLPLVRRGAWALALVTTVLWLAALYVFFVHFAGPGVLAHLGLWFLAVVGMCAPRRVSRLEALMRRVFPRSSR